MFPKHSGVNPQVNPMDERYHNPGKSATGCIKENSNYVPDYKDGLGTPFLRNADGVIPIWRMKTRLNVDFAPKPTS